MWWQGARRRTGPRREAAELLREDGPVAAPPTRPGQGEFEQVAECYDALMARVPYRRWVDYVERLIATRRPLPAPRRTRVLDLACGTGKVGSELRRRGYRVVGADLSEPMARHCARQHPPLPAAVMDATRLGLRPGSLDLVVCLYDSLNYLLEPEGLQECFRRVREALVPGGLFIFDLNTPRALQIGLFTQQELSPLAAVQYRWDAHWDEAARVCRVDMWFRTRGGSRESRAASAGETALPSSREPGAVREFTETHYERAYEEREVQEWLGEAGFSYVRSYDAYTLYPVGPLAERMYFVAQR